MDVGTIIAIVPVVILISFIVLLVKRRMVDGETGMDMRGVIGVLAVVMVAVLLTSSVPSSTSHPSFELYDCVPASDFGPVESVEGSAELVEIGGTEYVRMTGLGTFTVVSGEDSREYKVGKAHMDLVLLTGQSNSCWFTNPRFYDGDSPVAPGKAFYLGQETGSGNYAGLATQDDVATSEIMDLVGDDGRCRVAQMYPVFCSDYVEETSHRVLVINTGIGGKAIHHWDVGGECDIWMHEVCDRVSEIVSEGQIELSPTVALWSQGESDASRSAEYYVTKLVPLLKRLADGDYGFSWTKVCSCLPRLFAPEYDPILPVSVAQIAVSEVDPDFLIASTLAFHLSVQNTRDGVHYKQETYGWMAEAFARSAAVAMGVTPVAQTIVLCEDIGTVSELPSTVTCYGTSGEAFELSASWTDEGGGAWTASLSGNPRGTTILDGLNAKANIV